MWKRDTLHLSRCLDVVPSEMLKMNSSQPLFYSLLLQCTLIYTITLFIL